MRTSQTGKGLLHCFPCGRYFGGRSKEPVDGELTPVYGKTTIVSLPHACLAAGLLADVHADQPVNWPVLSTLVRLKWGGSVDRFLADAATVGVSPVSVAQRARSRRGAVIGWLSADRQGKTPGAKSRFGVCPDLELAVAILSCRTGDIFISERAPDLSWDTLFATAFECDEDLGLAPGLDQAPWQAYKWQLGGRA